MIAAGLRSAAFGRVSSRAFSSSASRATDVAKLLLIGRLGREPELRTAKNEKEYVSYTVATSNSLPPPNPDGSRATPTTSWHHIVSFSPSSNNFLRTLPKGAHVYVEASYELRDVDPSDTQGQRQIFLRHETIRVLKYPANPSQETPDNQEMS